MRTDRAGAAAFDFGATPNVFDIGSRVLVGVGQKSGVYHTFDIRTGAAVWRQQVAVPRPNGGNAGPQWGSSYDGNRLYVASFQAGPGTLFALDPATGKMLWSVPNPANGCTTGGAVAFPQSCKLALSAAVTSTPGLVYEGSIDGKMRVYSSSDGRLLWEYDTIRSYAGVNGETASGGSVPGNSGAVVSHGLLYVNSGSSSTWGINGRVLLAFGP